MITGKLIWVDAPHRYSAWASDLYDACPAFRTGWPHKVATNLGNGQPFIRGKALHDADGDVTCVYYTQANGYATLKVFND